MSPAAVQEGRFDVAVAVELRDRVEGVLVEPARLQVSIPNLADPAPERVVHIADVHPRLGDALQAPETVPSKPSPVSTEAG